MCVTEKTFFFVFCIEHCSLTPANPFRAAELYGQFTLFSSLYGSPAAASRVIPTEDVAKHQTRAGQAPSYAVTLTRVYRTQSRQEHRCDTTP